VVKSVVNEVKRFAKSEIGRIVITVAAAYFLGPYAANLLGVTSTAGVAAVSGFVGSFSSGVAAGDGVKNSLKAGAVGAVTAGTLAVAAGGTSALQAGSYKGPTSISGQYDKLKESLADFGTPKLAEQAAAVDPNAPAPILSPDEQVREAVLRGGDIGADSAIGTDTNFVSGSRAYAPTLSPDEQVRQAVLRGGDIGADSAIGTDTNFISGSRAYAPLESGVTMVSPGPSAVSTPIAPSYIDIGPVPSLVGADTATQGFQGAAVRPDAFSSSTNYLTGEVLPASGGTGINSGVARASGVDVLGRAASPAYCRWHKRSAWIL
jgi:hypothetical protein